MVSRQKFFYILTLLLGIAFAIPLSAQDAPLPLPYDGLSVGIINRAPFEIPPDLLPQTRLPFSVTVTTFADPAVGACNASDGMSLREALVNCSSPTVQPVIYLPTGTYILTSTIVVSGNSFTVIGQSPLNTFIEGSPTNIRYFDIGLTGANIVTFANLTLRNSTSTLSGNALRVTGNGTARLDNIRVTGNTGSTRGAVRLDVETNATLSVNITNSTFSGNTASTGGAVALTNELIDGVGILTISNSLFDGNNATSNGGGLLVNSLSGASTSVTLNRTVFSGTTSAVLGGGLAMTGNGDPAALTIIDSTFDNNTASGTGGGLFFNNNGGEISILDSTFTDNTFVTSGSGAGLMVNTAFHVSIDDSLFDNNDAKTGVGGAMYFDGNVGQISLTNTIVSNNKASNVGGIYAFLVDSITANGLIVTGNSAATEVGGALFAASNFVSLTDSSFTLNTAIDELGGLSTSRATLVNVRIEDNSAPIRPDCIFFALSGTSTSLGGVSITDMTGCDDGTLIPAAGDQLGNLLVNGGFEFAGATAGKPSGWTLKTITGDKRACNTAIKTLTPYGKCLMQFTGSATEKATLSQIVDLTGLTFVAAEELRLYAMGDGSSSASKLKITVTATYSDQPANKAILNFTGNQTGLTGQSQILTLTSAAVTKITVQIQHTSKSGKFLLDRVYLTR